MHGFRLTDTAKLEVFNAFKAKGVLPYLVERTLKIIEETPSENFWYPITRNQDIDCQFFLEKDQINITVRHDLYDPHPTKTLKNQVRLTADVAASNGSFFELSGKPMTSVRWLPNKYGVVALLPRDHRLFVLRTEVIDAEDDDAAGEGVGGGGSSRRGERMRP